MNYATLPSPLILAHFHEVEHIVSDRKLGAKLHPKLGI